MPILWTDDPQPPARSTVGQLAGNFLAVLVLLAWATLIVYGLATGS